MQSLILQLVYVDDLQLVVLGQDKFLGYWLDFQRCMLGISDKRGNWLLSFKKEMEQAKFTISMRRFTEFLGRLGFVARVLVWLKPHLAPLYSWAAALDRSTVASAPRLVRLVLLFLKRQFGNKGFLYSAQRPLQTGRELFRTGAKWAGNVVVLGGVELASGKRFSLKLTPSQAPFFFKSNGESQWASTSAELLATLAALVAFDQLDGCDRRTHLHVTLLAGTDNQSNEALLMKSSWRMSSPTSSSATWMKTRGPLCV